MGRKACKFAPPLPRWVLNSPNLLSSLRGACTNNAMTLKSSRNQCGPSDTLGPDSPTPESRSCSFASAPLTTSYAGVRVDLHSKEATMILEVDFRVLALSYLC